MRRPIDRFIVLCLVLAIGQTSALPSFFSAHTGPNHEASVDSPNEGWLYSVLTHDVAGISLPATYADPPRLPVPPSATISEGGGWLSRWLAFGGEGEVSIILGKHNLTLPHRPAAFPTQLLPPLTLPLAGTLHPFSFFLNYTKNTTQASTPLFPGAGDTFSSTHNPELGCLPSSFPIRFEDPAKPYKIALVERGGCDFASKVRAAQERGAAAVVVGDGKAFEKESDDEGRLREGLITMFSPEDTDSIFIPSIYVSRASYLALRDMLQAGTTSGQGYEGLWIEIGEAKDDGGTLGSMLSFALLMPSFFLGISIAIHRFRIARQKEADRAPPLLVLSLPERIWSPDIVWEKDSDTDSPSPSEPPSPSPASAASSTNPTIPPPPLITRSEVATPPAVDISNPAEASGSRKKSRSKSGHSAQRRYFSKDECAICMDSFERGDVVRILPCGHVFHKTECDEWLLKWRKLCPTCRADVTIPPGEVGTGTTLTPVMNSSDSDPLPSQTLVGRLRDVVRLRWDSLRGRGVQLDTSSGERTPLIDHSTRSSTSGSDPERGHEGV